MERFKTRSISKELALSLFLLVFLLEGALFAYLYARQSQFMRLELEKKSREYVANLSEVLAVPLWDFDDEQIHKIGANFARETLINELNITDLQGKFLYRYRDVKRAENRIKKSAEITHKGQKIGRIELHFSLAAFKRDLAWLRNVILFILAGSLIVIFITTGLLLRVLLRKPLDILQNGIDRVAKGDYAHGLDEIRHRELLEIAGRFREMALVIQERERSFSQINMELEAEIAEKKRAEDKIRESEARSRALLDAIPDMIFQLSAEGVFIDFRGRQKDLLVASENFIGNNIDDMLPLNISTVFRKNLSRALATNKVRFFEYELALDRHTNYFDCRIAAVTDETALCIVRNITWNKKAAAEKERLEEQLRQAQKMEALGALAGGVAHDLNNILSGIVSYPELLLLDVPPDSTLRKPLLIVKESGEKAATIVQDLLTLARRGVMVTEIANLNRMVDQYLISPELKQLKAHHSGIRITTRLEKQLLNISGSPVHLSKTVMNLISNAAEAMPHGGEILVSTRNQYVDLPVRGYDTVAEGDYVVLSVSDTGVGMSPREMERIFEPFYTKKVMGRSGTGFGMAVIWGTVKDHDGYVDIQSAEGKGTVITLYFPATRESPSKGADPVSIEDYKGRGETILVIDDVAEQRNIASDILSKLEYSVTAVGSGEQAVDYLRDHSVDLLVMDMIMDPGIDGLDTYKRILTYHPGQKAIIASGFSETERIAEARKLGAGAYIKKPYTMEKMGLTVKAELGKNRTPVHSSRRTPQILIHPGEAGPKLIINN